jgi:hypothetical protein
MFRKEIVFRDPSLFDVTNFDTASLFFGGSQNLIQLLDSHASHNFRCAYIQEFIRKYQNLLAWFSTNQRFIE